MKITESQKSNTQLKKCYQKIFRRNYPKNGLGVLSIPRQIRNCLFCDDNLQPIYTNIDIKNCHPVIYFQYLIYDKQYPKKNLRFFGNYIRNRDHWIQIFGKDKITAVISVINCCSKFLYKTLDDEKHNKQYENLLK